MSMSDIYFLSLGKIRCHSVGNLHQSQQTVKYTEIKQFKYEPSCQLQGLGLGFHTFIDTRSVHGGDVLSALLFIETPRSYSWMFTTRYFCTLCCVSVFVPPPLRLSQLYHGSRPASAKAKPRKNLTKNQSCFQLNLCNKSFKVSITDGKNSSRLPQRNGRFCSVVVCVSSVLALSSKVS